MNGTTSDAGMDGTMGSKPWERHEAMKWHNKRLMSNVTEDNDVTMNEATNRDQMSVKSNEQR